MPRVTGVASVQLGFPLIQQTQRSIGIPDFIAKIIGDAAVGIDVEKILTQSLWQEPDHDREILGVRSRQTSAVLLSLRTRGGFLGNDVLGRKAVPPWQAGRDGP